MKMVKVVMMHCPKCNKHTEHTVSLLKKGKERSQAEGARRYTRKQKGFGGQRKPRLRKTAKTTKKQTLKFKCKDCGYIVQKQGIRLRKLEIEA